MNDRRNSGNGRWLTVAEAAAVAGVSVQAVHGWIARGALEEAWTDDGHRRVDAAALGELLALRRAAGGAGIRLETLRRWVDESPSPP